MAVSVGRLGNGRLHRAVVVLPDAMGEPGRGYQERIVFFEVRGTTDAALHLERLLATASCCDTTGWCEDGAIYNIKPINELMERPATDAARELQLLEIGWGARAARGDPLPVARASAAVRPARGRCPGGGAGASRMCGGQREGIAAAGAGGEAAGAFPGADRSGRRCEAARIASQSPGDRGDQSVVATTRCWGRDESSPRCGDNSS